jgi:hypothetical protein
MIYLNPKDEQEASTLLEQLKQKSGKELSSQEIETLGSIMVSSEYPGLRSLIALKFEEALDPVAAPFLITTIKKNIQTKYLSTLIFSCSHFDCSEDIDLFIDLLMVKTDISFYESIWAIKNCKSVTVEVKDYSIARLSAYLDRIGKEDKYYEDISMTIEILRRL